MARSADYFSNHARRERFPWALYHQQLTSRIAELLRGLPRGARVLTVGCGLEPIDDDAGRLEAYGCDLDPRVIEACRAAQPTHADRLGVCPSAYELPLDSAFVAPFDLIIAKEVIEHVLEPERWARRLADALAAGGQLVLTTPNYAPTSTLPLLEKTVLELVARLDGFSRRDIHPSRFTASRLAALDLGPRLQLVELDVTRFGWALIARWRKAQSAP